MSRTEQINYDGKSDCSKTLLGQWEETTLTEKIENGNFTNNNEVKKMWILHNKLV